MWRSLLFVDNFVNNGATMCMGWSWYLQNDMQIFIYCIFVLLIYKYNKFACHMLIAWSICASFAFTMYQTFTHHYRNMTHLTDSNPPEYMGDVYIKPWARCPPYLYGLFLGMMYF